MPKNCYLLGIDIETAGPAIGQHPLLAIGMCVYSWNGKCDDKNVLKLLDTVEVHMDGDISEYDPSTLQFWKNNKAAWDIVRSDTVTKTEAAETLVKFLKKWQSKAATNKVAFKTITDNCWFDDTWTSWFLSTYGSHVGGRPLRDNYYSGYTKTCHMIDINQRIAAVTSDMSGIKMLPFKPSVPHDHTPVSDSRGIVEKYVNYMISLDSHRRK